MPTTSPRVDAYIAAAAPFAQPILEHLRSIIHQAAPDVEEAIKWSMPFFVYRGIIIGNMAAFKQHASFGLWGGSMMAEHLAEAGITLEKGMGTFGRLTSIADLPTRPKLLKLVKSAAKLIDEGTRTTSVPPRPRLARRPDPEVPEALAAALATSKAAAQHFAAMAPSCRREYCDWITSAKRDETRTRRLSTAVEWLAEGKKRNWQHESC